MGTATQLLLVGLVLSDLVLLATSRMRGLIRVVALQGLLLGLLPLVVHPVGPGARGLAIGLLTMLIKGVIFPWLLLRTLRRVGIFREVLPYVGYSMSIVIGCVAFGASLWLAARIPLPLVSALPLVVPVALLTVFVGLFLVVSRHKALSQAMGYLVFENGIYVFGVAFVGEIPLLVELGILLDGFVALFVMGIAIYRIRSEFDHIDADRLSALRG